MKKKKSLVKGACLSLGVLTALPMAAPMVSAVNVQPPSQEVLDVHHKLEHLRKSFKTNYLYAGNIDTWENYIKEAKKLNSLLPEGSSKDKYNERIEEAEKLIQAIARVSKLEESMDENSYRMLNVDVWEKYLTLGKEDLSLVNQDMFKNHYNNLLERLAIKYKKVEDIKVEYQGKIDSFNKELNNAIELAKTDPNKAIEKLNTLLKDADKLDTHNLKDKVLSSIKDSLSNIKPVEPPSTGGGGWVPPPPPPPVDLGTPNVKSDDNDDLVQGLTTEMQYRVTTGGVSGEWIDVVDRFVQFPGNVTVEVRYKALPGQVSGVATLTYTLNLGKRPAPTGVYYDSISVMFKGFTPDMLISNDGIVFGPCLVPEIITVPGEKIYVKYASGGGYEESDVVIIKAEIPKILSPVPSDYQVLDGQNSIVLMSDNLEYSLDNGLTWSSYNVTGIVPNLVGNLEIKLRFKEAVGFQASDPVTINMTDRKANLFLAEIIMVPSIPGYVKLTTLSDQVLLVKVGGNWISTADIDVIVGEPIEVMKAPTNDIEGSDPKTIIPLI
ncbi:MAG: hypothetical protein RR539_07900 [Clostridium sp.]|uniref:hypothetical protein n=1 Tax=Clostridium sp. TaxID=1506 RepID=UPI002FC877AF